MRESLRSYGHLRAIDAEALTVEAVIATGNVARDQMIIDPAGWDFTNYRKNPVVLWSHNDMAVPIAKTIGEVQTGPNELRATAEFDREDPEAVRLFGKVARGFINATSVRWLPKRTEIRAIAVEGGGERDTIVFVEQELLEWSFVAIPSDPGAVILRSNGDGLDIEALLAAARKAATPEITPEPEPEPVVTERAVIAAPQLDPRALQQIADALVKLSEPPDVEAIVIRAVAKATGKTEERVRSEMGVA